MHIVEETAEGTVVQRKGRFKITSDASLKVIKESLIYSKYLDE